MNHSLFSGKMRMLPATVDADSLDAILALVKQMEATLLGLKQLRVYVGTDVGWERLEVLIQNAENHLAEVKRKVIQ